MIVMQDLRRKLPVTRTLFPWQNTLQFSLTRDITKELGIGKWIHLFYWRCSTKRTRFFPLDPYFEYASHTPRVDYLSLPHPHFLSGVVYSAISLPRSVLVHCNIYMSFMLCIVKDCGWFSLCYKFYDCEGCWGVCVMVMYSQEWMASFVPLSFHKN